MCDIYWFVVVVTTFQDLTKTLGQHNTDFIVSFILCVQGRAQTATFFFFLILLSLISLSSEID